MATYTCVLFSQLSCVWLFWDPMDYSLPNSSGISQARILERVTIPSQEDLPCQGIKLMSPELVGRFFTTEPRGKPIYTYVCVCVCVHIYK